MDVLAGIRVVDLAQNIAGPYCTQLLGDLGADVIKIEPPGGDPARRWGPPFWGGEAPLFLSFNRNKRSVVLDLKSEGGREVLWRLVDTADVFVQAYRTGVAERLGYGVDAVRARRPAIVYVSVSGYGSRGPLAERPGYDPLIQAYSGLVAMTGHPDGPPARVGGSVNDVGTGTVAALGVLAALLERNATGEGSHVEASLLATSLGWLPYHLQGYLATGTVPGRMGTGLASIAPYSAFPTADGELMISAGNDAIFHRLCEALEASDLADDPRFSSNAERVAHREVLWDALAARTSTMTRNALQALLDRHRVPAAPIQDVSHVASDEQVQAEGLLRRVDHPRIADYRDVAPPLRLDGRRPPARRPPPASGQHTAEVLRELGYDEEHVARMV